MKNTENMVGKRIKAYLATKGIMQAKVATEAGLTHAQMSQICNGKRSLDCVEYSKICKTLGVDYGYFLEE